MFRAAGCKKEKVRVRRKVEEGGGEAEEGKKREEVEEVKRLSGLTVR